MGANKVVRISGGDYGEAIVHDRCRYDVGHAHVEDVDDLEPERMDGNKICPVCRLTLADNGVTVGEAEAAALAIATPATVVPPTCAKCDSVVGLVIGMPVWITIQPDGSLATVGCDLSDLADGVDSEALTCKCGEPEVDDAGMDALTTIAGKIAEGYMLELDCDLP